MKLNETMGKVLFGIVIGFAIIPPAITFAATLVFDGFSGTTVSSSKWHIPTWVSPTDGHSSAEPVQMHPKFFASGC